MPKFVYTFIVIFLASSMVLARTIFWTSPESPLSLFVFFFSLFLTVLSFLAGVLSIILLPRHRDITNQRIAFRKIFRFGLILSVLIVAVGVLKVIGALSTLNLILLLLLTVIYGFFIYK
mgnify:CR=1 FL=1